MKLTNNGNSPQGVYDKRGRVVVVEPGETKEADINEAEVKYLPKSLKSEEEKKKPGRPPNKSKDEAEDAVHDTDSSGS